jgi:GT2 family glycosyltransferase
MPCEGRPVSIVVLTYNQLAYTRQCFEHLFANTENFQLVVVDNASTDGTPAYLQVLERQRDDVRVVLNSTNTGFAAGCNRGVSVAQHGLICLLNNDVIPLPGWLNALRAVFDKGVGAVGSRLLWPNLLIQHAGIAFQARQQPALHFMPVHRFLGAPHDLPAANVLEEVAGVTAACLLTSRTVWSRVGGMDEGFVIGNFEDVDFNLKARESGLKVLYQPASRLIHYGHASFTGQGASDTTARNFERLSSRWTHKLAQGLWAASPTR